MSIRAAKPEDAAAIASIWNGMIAGSLFTFTNQLKTEAEIRALIEARPRAVWLAEADGQGALAGFVTYGTFRNGPGYAATVEHSIVLAEGARRSGTGRRLMERAMAEAAQQGMHVMVAGISAVNSGAVAFHAALGFVEAGRLREVGRKNDQWLDLILMQKTLTSD